MPSGHEGHRKRLMNKLASGTLETHELLELLLFYSIPRKDTNGIAHRALESFGGLTNLFNADLEQLQQVDGIGENSALLITCVSQLAEKLNQAGKNATPKKYEYHSFLKYAEKEYRALNHEVFDVYLLKADQSIQFRKRFTSDSVNSVKIDPCSFSKLLAINRPAGVVLVHNHPSGSEQPSEKDDETTKGCQTICRIHNAMLCEHIVCAPTGSFSYYHSGRLSKLFSDGIESSLFE